MLTQNRVIKVETCSIHIGFGHTYKYSVQVYLLACLVDLDGPAVLCCAAVGEAFVFCLKTGCTSYFQPITLLLILLRSFDILGQISLILAIVEPDCTFDHCCMTQLERVTCR